MANIIRSWNLDPAIINFGQAVLEIRDNDLAWRISYVGMILKPLNDMGRDFYKQVAPYSTEIQGYRDAFMPEYAVIERFMNRGMFGASMNEKVNIMIGIAAEKVGVIGCKVLTTTPSVWKNEFHRRSNVRLNVVYNEIRKALRAHVKLKRLSAERGKAMANSVPHITDSVIMGLVTLRPVLKAPQSWLNPADLIRKITAAIIAMEQRSHRSKAPRNEVSPDRRGVQRVSANRVPLP